MSDFKLSAQLAAHDADVRDVLFPAPDLILSASRDRTVRAWKRTSTSPPAFEPSITNQGTEFVNSLAYLPPSSEFPQGLVVSGGTDTIIDVRATTSGSSDNAERLLIGHARNVCALEIVPGGKYIVSGSWDQSARIWSVGKWESEVILGGHEGAVWDVLPLDDTTVITACADKSIRIYDLRTSTAGEAQPRSTIYSPDVTRALCKVPEGHPSGADIASASNDGVVRLWKLTGQQVGELHGHENFIYSLATLPSGEIVSAGEDRTVRIWRGSECVQTITHPAISVWTVAANPETGDIVSGASDGVVRVFTRSQERIASAETIAHFDESVKSSSIPQQQLGDINPEKLPGPDFLQAKSGTKEGQVQLIKEDSGTVTAYQWSVGQQQWINVGAVVDAVGSSGKKVEHNGKSYDYVFDVALEEGAPSLKLPYNLSENPYTVAQKFIDDNELSQNFLDDVAQFIINNTKGTTIGEDSGSSGPDPYGTESRYRPGQESSSRAKALPQRDYLDITAAKYEPVFKKILSINSGLIASNRKDHALNPQAVNVLGAVREALEANKPIANDVAIHLIVMMSTQWDYTDRLAPLDLLRCITTSPATAKYKSPDSGGLIQVAVSGATTGMPEDSQPNENYAMMALRAIANLFKSADGRKLLAQSTEAIQVLSLVERVLGIGGQPPIGQYNRNLLVALTTVLLNYAVMASRHVGSVGNNVLTRFLSALARVLKQQTDGEVVYRALVAVGTFITVIGAAAPEARSLASSITVAKDKVADARAKEVADECLALLR